MNSAQKTFRGLTIIRLDTERSYAVNETIARIYFQLSAPPPLGWSYIFTTIWQTMALKCHAEVDDGAIWIECVPEQVVTHHIGQLEVAVGQTNAAYCKGAQQQAFIARRQAQAEAQFRARLVDLGRILYPEEAPAYESDEPERLCGSTFLARLRRMFFGVEG